MRTYAFKDISNTLASTEKANTVIIHARSRISALNSIAWYNKQNLFNYFGKVFVAAATFTTSSKTLTLSGTFARYVLANSTRIIITGGTGVTLGEYVIASRSSDNAIILTADIGGSNPSDVAGYIIGGRTVTPIERTHDGPISIFPTDAYGTSGSSLNKGVAANESLRGLIYEIPISAT